MSVSLPRYEPSRISLNGKRHYTCSQFPNVPEGMLLPSVTTVLSSMAPVGKIMALMAWRNYYHGLALLARRTGGMGLGGLF